MNYNKLVIITIIAIYGFGGCTIIGYEKLNNNQLKEIEAKLEKASTQEKADLNWFIVNANDHILYDPDVKFDNINQYIDKVEKAKITTKELANQLYATLRTMPMFNELNLSEHFKKQLEAPTLDDYRDLIKHMIEDLHHIQDAVHQASKTKLDLPTTPTTPPKTTP